MGRRLDHVARSICDTHDLTYLGYVGCGAFKETYHVSDLAKRSIALKIFASISSPKRTQREINAMLKCDHPNIGRLWGVSKIEVEGKQYLFLIEEYLPGGTLAKRLDRGVLSKGSILAIAKHLVAAISHIASQNLVHRDIKPDNIMFRADNRTPVIVDFGLVRDLDNASLTQTWLVHGPGTPFYASPEQLNNDKHLIDWRSDQFSLGVVLGMALLGTHPFSSPSGSIEDVVERVASRSSIAIDVITRISDEGLGPIVRMVEPWPINRYRTPDELFKAWQNC